MRVNLQTGLFFVSLGPALAATRLLAFAGTAYQGHPSLPYGFPAIREHKPYQIETPTGTVTIVVDRPQGVMDIFAEHEPHPLDWAVAVEMIKCLAYPEDLGEPDYLKGIDTWRITLKG